MPVCLGWVHRGKPLTLPCAPSPTATADVLLEYGANTHATDAQGRSPLHYAYTELQAIHTATTWLVNVAKASPKEYEGPRRGEAVGFDVLSGHDEGNIKLYYGEPPVRTVACKVQGLLRTPHHCGASVTGSSTAHLHCRCTTS